MPIFDAAPVDPPELVDDRGAAVGPLRLWDVTRAATDPDPARSALAVHLRDAVRGEARVLTVSGVVLRIVLVVLWIMLQVFVTMTGLGRWGLVSFAAFFGGIALVGLVIRADARRRIAGNLAVTAVANGICGSCCYTLKELPVEVDGCVVCPECGAAWTRARMTSPYWEVRKRSKRASRWPRWLTATPRDADLMAPDARGRLVRVLDSRLFLLGREERAALGEDRAQAIVRRIRRIGRWRRGLTAAFPFALLMALLYAGFGALADGGWEVALGMLIVTAILGFLIVAALRSHAGIRPRRLARTLVDEGVCPACGLGLDASRRAEDRLVECAGCGAAWGLRVNGERHGVPAVADGGERG